MAGAEPLALSRWRYNDPAQQDRIATSDGTIYVLFQQFTALVRTNPSPGGAEIEVKDHATTQAATDYFSGLTRRIT